MDHRHRIIILLGPTACGKTSFGVALAARIRAAGLPERLAERLAVGQ